MNPSKYAFPAGLFILLSIAGGIFLIAQVAESRSAPADAKTYTAVFNAGEDIAGLAPGAEVRLMGVKVGRVESVTVVTPQTPDQDASIHVKFVVGRGVELRQSKARIELQTAVTGGAWLNILSVGTGDALAQGSEVQATTTDLLAMMKDVRDELKVTLDTVRVDVDAVTAELIEASASIQASADSATTLIDKLDPEMKTFFAKSNGVMDDIRAVFGDSGEDIRTTLANLNTLTTNLDTSLPETLEQVTAFVTRAETSIDGIDTLVEELTGTATEAKTLLKDSRPDIDRTIQSARRSVDELEGLVDDLRANPSRLIWPPDEKDLKNQELYATARSYAKAAEDLESAAAALLAASKSDATDPKQLETLRNNLMQQFKHFDTLQNEVWKKFEK